MCSPSELFSPVTDEWDSKASKKGKKGTAALLRHHPDKTEAPCFWAKFKNSLESLVFPHPASPEMKIVLPFPFFTSEKHSSNFLSSSVLPTSLGSVKLIFEALILSQSSE
jgi:hypothetical protein